MKLILSVVMVALGAHVGLGAPVFLDGAEAARYVEGLEKHAAEMKRTVLESASVYPKSADTFYVAANGNDANDGRSPERPLASLAKVNALPLKPGAVVLFRRGDLFRGQLKVRAGVTYSAYGTGSKPTLCRSKRDYADPALWRATDIPGVWQCTLPIENAGVITCDHDPNDPKEFGRYDVCTARLRHSRQGVPSPRHLEKDLEFWSDLEKKILYLRSEQNPGARFRRIEIGEGGHGVSAGSERDVTIDNLHVTLAGCHGVGAGTTVNLEVRNCLFDWIGGSLLIPEGKKGGPCRFGNAVEVYGGCDGYRVHDNWMYQIYDTGITHQCHHAKNGRIFQKSVEYARNLIEYCFWSIEYYNAFNGYGETRDVHVHHNFCRFGGEGWGCPGRAGGTPMFSIDDRPDVTSNYVNEANILQHSRGFLVNNFGRHAPEMRFKGNVYVQPRGWRFAQIGDRKPRVSSFDESAADVMRETFGETDGTYVFIPDPDKPRADGWQLGPFTTRNGDIVTVDIPTNRPGCGAATMPYDFSRFRGEAFEATIRARGFNLTTPKENWLGFKFMGSYADTKTGRKFWPGAAHRPGTWGWQTVRFTDMNTRDRGPGQITLGLQNGGGKVEFDLSTLKFRELPPLWPATNLTHRCVYSPRVAAWPIHRGVMLGHGLKETDFKVLHDWGVTLARFQMTRGWNTPGANRDLADYGRYIDGCLDDLENHLAWARKYGIKIVVDLHAAPGARDEDHDEHMFHDAVYADAFIATWRKIATRFRGREEIFGFDLINEPQQLREALPGCDYWTLQSRAAEAIRAIDPETPIIVESNLYDAPQSFAYLHPLALTNIIYQAHMYVPMEFTHQGVFDAKSPATVYPDAGKGWNIDYLRKALRPVVEFQKRHGARIYLGEFSAIVWGEGADAYIRDCISVFRENGWDWTYHAFREWSGWSVEHAAPARWKMVPSADNPRKRALLSGFRDASAR